MLIVASGQDVRSLIPANDRSIRLVHLNGNPEIGAARNIGCARALGSVICHWDDDDHSEPHRLRDQVDRLIASGKSVTAYGTLRFTDGRRWWQYNGFGKHAPGSSLLYRRDWWRDHPFPAKHVGEDTAFITAARSRNEIVFADGGDLMYATVHQGNTSPRQLRGKAWKELKVF